MKEENNSEALSLYQEDIYVAVGKKCMLYRLFFYDEDEIMLE